MRLPFIQPPFDQQQRERGGGMNTGSFTPASFQFAREKATPPLVCFSPFTVRPII